MGYATPSSNTICAAFNIFRLSASANTSLRGSLLALLPSTLISWLSKPSRLSSSIAYSLQLVIFVCATPDAIAAFATAGATVDNKRGSRGLGIIYEGPKTILFVLCYINNVGYRSAC